MKKTRMILFFIAVVILNIAANLAHPITPTIIKNLNLKDYMFGAVYAAMMFSNFLFSPFWGKRNEYRNSKNTIALCCFGYSIGQLLFGISKTGSTILCARAFSGVFTGGIFVSFLTYLVHISKDKEKGRNLAILAAVSSVASAFGYFIGGMLGERSIMLVFLLQAGMLVFCGILFWIVCEEDGNKEDRPSYRQRLLTANPFAAFFEVKRFLNKRFIILFLVCGLSYLGFTAFEQCFNYYIKDIFGLTSGYNGTIKAVIGIASLIANATICIWIMKRTNVAKSTMCVLLICTSIIFAVTFTRNQTAFISLSILFFVFNALIVPITQEMVSSEAATKDSSIVMGFYNGIKSLGGIFGALAAGIFYTVHPTLPIVFAGISFLVATIFAGLLLLKTPHKAN